MTTLNVETVDLSELVSAVGQRVDSPLEGGVVGRTQIRDLVAAHLGCSLLEAEQLVDTMVGRGFARLEREPDGREFWLLGAVT